MPQKTQTSQNNENKRILRVLSKTKDINHSISVDDYHEVSGDDSHDSYNRFMNWFNNPANSETVGEILSQNAKNIILNEKVSQEEFNKKQSTVRRKPDVPVWVSPSGLFPKH
jgi:hypothetical protein